ncbi:MAG: ROK family protein [Actinomycetota bacterium]|nr:ROK family protein [Actinomycetota bacterium]
MTATVGLDVGGTKLLAVVLDDSGAVLAAGRADTPRAGPRRAGVSQAGPGRAGARGGGEAGPAGAVLVQALVELALRVAGGASADISAVGVGVPGLVDPRGVLRFAPNLPAGEGVDFSSALRAGVGVSTIAVGNDATCAALGELTYGAASGLSDVLVVTLGTGIGGGVVVNGEILRGANGFAGEIGHVVVDPGGPACSCGQRGCWERYASGSGLARLAREAALGGRIDSVVRLAGGDPEAVRPEHVTAAAASGDQAAEAVMDELGWWIALGVANLVSVLDPELVVLGGGLMAAGDLVLTPTRRAFGKLLQAAHERPAVGIVAAGLGENAGAVGAAVMARAEQPEVHRQ